MIPLYGPARQNGYVVENLEEAIARVVERFGAGPFHLFRHVPMASFRYGDSTAVPDMSIALGNFGDLQIELIKVHDDTPSPYRDFTLAKGTGLHHVSTWTTDYDGHLKRLEDRGLVPDCEGQAVDGPRFAYYASSATDGSAYEVADLGAQNEFGAVHDLVRAAAQNWDGTDPVRVML
ncbi:VOC family protein [Streptomyces pseudoechinosporeus]